MRRQCRLERFDRSTIVGLSGIDLPEPVISFSEDDFEFSFCPGEVSGAMIVAGRFVVFTKQIALRWYKEEK